MNSSKLGKLTSILLLMIVAPSYAFELGVGVHLRSYGEEAQKYVELVEQSNFNAIREDFTWDQVEKVPGQYSVSGTMQKVDDFINGSRKYNINTLLVLDYGNKNITSRNYPTTDDEINKFASYAQWTAERYKGKVKYYEIWNEWLVGSGVPKRFSRPDDSIYLKLVKETSMAIRKVDPEAIIITGSLNPLVHRDRKWMLDLIKNGLLNYVDGISLHPYSYMLPNKQLNTPSNAILSISSFEGQVRKEAGRDVPFYITEMGYPTYSGASGVSEVDAANWIVEYSMLAKQTGYIKGVWWYDLINDGNNAENKEFNFGFYTHDLQEKKSAVQIKKLGAVIRSSNLFSQGERSAVPMKSYQLNSESQSSAWSVYNLQSDNGNITIRCPSVATGNSDSLCEISK
ncbi:hypothetical protein [Serratia marcescens]|uniref:hypothetical protein n=1 Tax=Serratia marcescens TaxID=615 RepID=UPI0035181E72